MERKITLLIATAALSASALVTAALGYTGSASSERASNGGTDGGYGGYGTGR